MAKSKINMGGLNAMFGDAPVKEEPKAPTPEKKVAPKRTAVKKAAPKSDTDYEGTRATFKFSHEVLQAIRMEYAKTGKNRGAIVNEILEKHFGIKP